MSLPTIHHLIEELTKWRETERAAQMDVEDTEAHLIACDLRHQEAKRAHKCVEAKVKQVEDELADAICDHTAPISIEFTPDEDDA